MSLRTDHQATACQSLTELCVKSARGTLGGHPSCRNLGRGVTVKERRVDQASFKARPAKILAHREHSHAHVYLGPATNCHCANMYALKPTYASHPGVLSRNGIDAAG